MSDLSIKQSSDLAEMTVEIVAAYVAGNHLQAADLPALISRVHAAVSSLGKSAEPGEPTVEKVTPAQIRKSITPDALISFEDGRPYKALRRHLTTRGLTPEAYRAKWGLPVDYPMTAASYSETRSAISKAIGLGRKPEARTQQADEPVAAEATPAAPKRRGRAKKEVA